MNNDFKALLDKFLEVCKKGEPELFEQISEAVSKKVASNKYFDLTRLKPLESDCKCIRCGIFSSESSKDAGFVYGDAIQIRVAGEYNGKAFFLNDSYHWEIVKDSSDTLCLLPTKKEE